jgi:peptidoglycan/xylan/chitin deacetylase (PgdA/CDA1 family)
MLYAKSNEPLKVLIVASALPIIGGQTVQAERLLKNFQGEESLPPPAYAPLSWQQAREMDTCNMLIESHTVSHPILPNTDLKDLTFEVEISKQRLEDIFGRRIRHFCYPNGSLNERVQRSVQNAGYESGVTTEYGFNERTCDMFALKRIDAPPAIENFAQSVSGFEALRLRARG